MKARLGYGRLLGITWSESFHDVKGVEDSHEGGKG